MPCESYCYRGIYFLIDNDRVVYVGQAVNVVIRVMTHMRAGKKFDAVSFYSVADDSEITLKELEDFFIEFLCPSLNNTANVKRLRQHDGNARRHMRGHHERAVKWLERHGGDIRGLSIFSRPRQTLQAFGIAV